MAEFKCWVVKVALTFPLLHLLEGEGALGISLRQSVKPGQTLASQLVILLAVGSDDRLQGSARFVQDFGLIQSLQVAYYLHKFVVFLLISLLYFRCGL